MEVYCMRYRIEVGPQLQERAREMAREMDGQLQVVVNPRILGDEWFLVMPEPTT